MVVWLPPDFPSSPKMPENEYSPPPVVCRDRNTGEPRYRKAWSTGAIWLLCNMAKPGQKVTLSFFDNYLNCSVQDANRRVNRLASRGEIEYENVVCGDGVRRDLFWLSPLGQQRQAEHDAKAVEEDW